MELQYDDSSVKEILSPKYFELFCHIYILSYHIYIFK